MIREVMPRVRVEYQDGHLVAWRPDLLSISQDELIGLSKDGPEGPARNGALLGYGLESMAGQEPHALVVIKDENGEVISGFLGNRLRWRLILRSELLTDSTALKTNAGESSKTIGIGFLRGMVKGIWGEDDDASEVFWLRVPGRRASCAVSEFFHMLEPGWFDSAVEKAFHPTIP